MSESATSASPRERRRTETAHALISLARRATAEHGLNGFTVDELCERAGVSRRTFFNYFASKEDAVLGFSQVFDTLDAEQRFVDARPGDLPPGTVSPTLVADLVVLVEARWAMVDFDRTAIAELMAAAEREPRLITHMLDRGRRAEEQDAALVARREGLAPGHPLAEMAVQVVGHLSRVAVPLSLDPDDPQPYADVLERLVADAHALFTVQHAPRAESPQPESSR